MKKLLLLSLLTLVACGDKQGKTGENTVIDTLYLPDSGKEALKKVITVKDTSRYSEKFIEDFKKDDYLYDVTLIDSCLITNGDSIQIPLDLKLNREYLFAKSINLKGYEVFIRRTGLTKINYTLKEEYDYDEDNYIVGEAELSGRFFDDKHSYTDSTLFKNEVFVTNRYHSLQDKDIFIDIGENESKDSIRVVLNIPEKGITTDLIFEQQIYIEPLMDTKDMVVLLIAFIVYIILLIFVFAPIYAVAWRFVKNRTPVRGTNWYMRFYEAKKENDREYEEYLKWAAKRGYKPIIKKRN